MSDLPPLVYVSMDELAAGVGASQVLPYVERLSQLGLDVTVHSFEQGAPAQAVRDRLAREKVTWVPHDFGRPGVTGGVGRVLRAASAVRRVHGPYVLHARSDLAAAAAMLGGAETWIWDVRSFWADQRIALGMLRQGGIEDRVLRRVEAAAARRSSGIVTLTGAAIPVLEQRHGRDRLPPVAVVPTCVDLDRFALVPPRSSPQRRFLLSGSLNAYYDVPTAIRLVERSQMRRPSSLHVLSPGPTAWDGELIRAGAILGKATPEEMPRATADAHVGLSICRSGAGVSLRAAMPTKIAEFLAVGRPVVVNKGLGDTEQLLRTYDCGVVLRATTPEALEEALDRLDSLIEDPDLAHRCRNLAEDHFDLDQGVRELLALYGDVGT